MAELDKLPVTLIDVLANSVILRQLAPYIPIRSLLDLSGTSKAIRNIVLQPEPWRHLDLTGVKSAIIESAPIDIGGFSWRAERMDESLTEEDFYAGPLRGHLGRLHQKQVLKNVQTLILDGLSVPADLINEIVTQDRYSVKMLSIRESNNLNQAKLQKILRYITRPTRAEGTPKLKALYYFGPKDSVRPVLWQQRDPPSAPLGVMDSEGAQIGAEWNHRSSVALGTCISDDETKWYSSTGRVMKRPLSDWPETLQTCKGLINFDAVLCRGPKHDITKVDSSEFLQPAVATVALGGKGFHLLRIHPPYEQLSTPKLTSLAILHSSSAVKIVSEAAGANAATAGGAKIAIENLSTGFNAQSSNKSNFKNKYGTMA